ncbi:MAG: glutathione S-transferase, partial [Lysobacterales bacterium]
TYHLPLSTTALAYAQRLLDLAPMREWYEAALKETWRELAHDAEIEAAGEIIEDLRAPAEA